MKFKPFVTRSLRVSTPMHQASFSLENEASAKSYMIDLKKKGFRVRLDKMVQIVYGRKNDGSLKITSPITEGEYQRMKKSRIGA
jgi:hypothetical protein